MDRHIGIDVHARSSTVAVIDAVGKRVGKHVVETNGQALVACVKMVPGRRHLCMEEGTQSAWLYEVLRPHVDDVAVVCVRESRGPKDDERDAFEAAEKLRTGAVGRRVFKEVGPYGKLRELGRAHSCMVCDVVQVQNPGLVQNRIKATLRSRGVPTEGKAVYGQTGR